MTNKGGSLEKSQTRMMMMMMIASYKDDDDDYNNMMMMMMVVGPTTKSELIGNAGHLEGGLPLPHTLGMLRVQLTEA